MNPQPVENMWITHVKCVNPCGIQNGAVWIKGGRIAAVRSNPPKRAAKISLNGAFLAPGFIDLHVWGYPQVLSRTLLKGGTTGYLAALPPLPEKTLLEQVDHYVEAEAVGARFLGLHLEGPFINPQRAGALASKAIRKASVRELRRIVARAGRMLKCVTLAPEQARVEIIKWLRAKKIAVSLGHSCADAKQARRAVETGARLVTHVYNGMLPLDHHKPGLIDVALADKRVITMLIADGIHVSREAIEVLLRMKGFDRIALVTDAITHAGWKAKRRGGAYYREDGTLAGSAIRMIDAVRFMNERCKVPLHEAVAMATRVPARALGLRGQGELAPGNRADLVAFDRHFRVQLTCVGGAAYFNARK